MSTIRVVWGSASAPTAMASYDAALAEAGVENYNLVSVSSVIPAGVDVEAVGTAPDLGPAGERLTVVEARATAAGPGRVSAALAWAQSVDDGPGLFYETAGETDRDDVERRVREGLAAGPVSYTHL
ncbi:pyruvoyl-dependent arginine decarboxylase [Natrinema pallidum DSM 3751]|uniref:arginine decarboxylase n=1 Tax=Natrinema pallidum DSM 3751 TaxID=1227495 RepID=L9ZAQ0_9EURY|nr:pyruvoyl-dependent arginine decarboxylase [Natrinema pallidum DSM 3751]